MKDFWVIGKFYDLRGDIAPDQVPVKDHFLTQTVSEAQNYDIMTGGKPFVVNELDADGNVTLITRSDGHSFGVNNLKMRERDNWDVPYLFGLDMRGWFEETCVKGYMDATAKPVSTNKKPKKTRQKAGEFDLGMIFGVYEVILRPKTEEYKLKTVVCQSIQDLEQQNEELRAQLTARLQETQERAKHLQELLKGV